MKASAILAALSVPLTMAVMTACGSDEATPAPVVEPTSTRTVPPGMEPPVQRNDPGYPEVTFDPCLDVDDSAIRSMGFDPNSRRRFDMATEVTFLRCTFANPSRMMTLMSANVTFEEERRMAAGRESPIDMNGREAFIGPNGVNKYGCTLVMRTPAGVAIVDTSDAAMADLSAMPPSCDGVPEIGRIFERSIPKEK